MAKVAERPSLRQVPHVSHRRREAIGERSHMDNPGVAAGVIHLADFAGVEAERLFAHHVLAMFGGSQRDGEVSEVRRGNDDGVDAGVSAELLVVGGQVRDSPVLAALLQKFRTGIASAYELGPRVKPNTGDVVIVADGSGADDGDVNGGGHWSDLGLMC